MLDRFLGQLPHDTAAAAELGRNASRWMKARRYTEVDEPRPLRHALEVRHGSFQTPAFIALLRKHKVAAVVADTAGKWPAIEDVTADFMYVRLHGDEEIYVSGYTDAALDAWAVKIHAWRTGGEPKEAKRVSPKPPPKRKARDVFVYFDNDVKVLSPRDAMSLAERLNARGRRADDGPRSERRHGTCQSGEPSPAAELCRGMTTGGLAPGSPPSFANQRSLIAAAVRAKVPCRG